MLGNGKNQEAWLGVMCLEAAARDSSGVPNSNGRLMAPPAKWRHLTLWPSKVTQPFEGQGQLDSHESKVTGARGSLKEGNPRGKFRGGKLGKG